MDKVTKGMSEAGKAATRGPADRPGSRQGDLNTKGSMREPSQTPGAASGDLEEVKEALQEVEEKEGDWSRGGG